MAARRGGPINGGRGREAAGTGADIIAGAFPFCTVMLDAGVRETGAKLQVVHLATLLSEAVDRKQAKDAAGGQTP